MFTGCSSLTSLDFSYFETSELNDASSAFSGCTALSSIKMDDFNTTKATSLNSMFYSCSSLTSLYLPNFDTRNINGDGISKVFEGCRNLKLSLNRNKCANLILFLPLYVELLNITEIFELFN